MKAFWVLILIGMMFHLHGQEVAKKYEPTATDIQAADKIAHDVADWFTYTTGAMKDERMGQCGDYALMFILKYNKYAGENVARFVDSK